VAKKKEKLRKKTPREDTTDMQAEKKYLLIENTSC